MHLPEPGEPTGTRTIAEVSALTGLSAHTLRYYERAGLVHAVTRDPGGRRRYAAADLDWLTFLVRLRETGMSIADMRAFADLRQAGPATVADRLAHLESHRAAVAERIAALRDNAAHLDVKIDHYRGLVAADGGTSS